MYELKDNTVLVHGDEAGNVVIPSRNNPKYGHIKVSEVRMVTDDTGFARKREIYALIPGEINDLKYYKWTKGQYIEGKIVIKERLTPFNTKEPDRDLKVAGKTGIVCMIGDNPIYRKNFWTTDLKAHDELREHTNSEVIKAAYAVIKEKEITNPTKEASDKDMGSM